MTVNQSISMSVPTPDGGNVTIAGSISAWDNPPPPKPRTIIGLDDPTPDAGLAAFVGARRCFAGDQLPVLTGLPAHVLAMPSHPTVPANQPTPAAGLKMFLSRPAGVMVPNHECNRPGKPTPAQVAKNFAWWRQQVDAANATGKVTWLLAINFDSYPQMHGGATFDQYDEAIQLADLVTWDLYADLAPAQLPTLDAFMAPYRATRKAYPGKRGGVLELGVMARATGTPPARTPQTHQDAADLYADAIDEVVDDGGFVVCVWGTAGSKDQIDKVTGQPIDYTLQPGSPEYVVVRDRMRAQ